MGACFFPRWCDFLCKVQDQVSSAAGTAVAAAARSRARKPQSSPAPNKRKTVHDAEWNDGGRPAKRFNRSQSDSVIGANLGYFVVAYIFQMSKWSLLNHWSL